MKIFLALVIAAAIGAGAVYALDRFGGAEDEAANSPTGSAGDRGDPAGDVTRTVETTELTGTACERLAGLADQLAAGEPAPVAFLRGLGREAAGIRAGDRTLIDLARGGRNRIPGKGFREEFDDGTEGQVRHFAGVAFAATLGGAGPTRWISERLRDDPRGSPDGRLTEEAIAFSGLVLGGELEHERAEGWLRTHLCA